MTGFLNAFDDVVHGFRKGAAFSLIIIGKLSFIILKVFFYCEFNLWELIGSD